MCFFNDIDLYRKIVRGNINVLSQFPNGINTKRCLVTAIDVNDVGGVALKDLSAGRAAQAGQGCMSILAVLAGKSGSQAESQRVLSESPTTLADSKAKVTAAQSPATPAIINFFIFISPCFSWILGQ